MKHKRQNQIERRRHLVEVNLIAEGGMRQSITKRGSGCLSFLSPSLLTIAALAAHALGLL
jgi:hypothetical protein